VVLWGKPRGGGAVEVGHRLVEREVGESSSSSCEKRAQGCPRTAAAEPLEVLVFALALVVHRSHRLVVADAHGDQVSRRLSSSAVRRGELGAELVAFKVLIKMVVDDGTQNWE
jgi:hypothetical protein